MSRTGLPADNPCMASNLVRKNAELRRHRRYPLAGSVRILFQDAAGRDVVSKGQLVNVSVSGLQMMVDHQIPVRSYLFCNEPKLGISGRGSVRYCRYLKGKYAVGVDFSSGTGWREPAPPELVADDASI
jgi:PilZ domain